MKALCYNGVGELRTERVPDPTLLNPKDAILRVILSSVCGSDLHLLNGYVPTMREGDIIGHESVLYQLSEMAAIRAETVPIAWNSDSID